MSHGIAHLDCQKRALEKQRGRDEDQMRLDDGSVTPSRLRRENSAFSALPLHRYKMVAIGEKVVAHS